MSTDVLTLPADVLIILTCYRSLAKFTFNGDDEDQTVTIETSMVAADFSYKGLGVSGTIVLAPFLAKCQ